MAVYVEDFLLFSNDQSLVDSVKQQLSSDFQMKDLGEVRQILGMNITRSDGIVANDQKKYIEELLTKFRMEDCNTVSTPMDNNQKLTKDMYPKTAEEKRRMSNIPFRELIGGLQFIA